MAQPASPLAQPTGSMAPWGRWRLPPILATLALEAVLLADTIEALRLPASPHSEPAPWGHFLYCQGVS